MAITLDVTEIKKILPHRFPMLLVDRILDLEPMKWAVGIKNVSVNEMQFLGHFPFLEKRRAANDETATAFATNVRHTARQREDRHN